MKLISFIRLFLLSAVIFPILSFGQSIDNAMMSNEALCAGEEECANFTFVGLDNSQEYNLIIKDSEDPEGPFFNVDVVFNLTNEDDFDTDNNTYNVCFGNDDYHILILTDASSGTHLDTIAYKPSPYPNPFDFSSFNNPATCFGDSDATIVYSIGGGTEPISGSWTGPNGANGIINTTDITTLENLFAGVYTFSVTDDNGCPFSEIVEISEPEDIQFNIDLTDESCFDFNDGIIEVNGTSGGNGGYTFNVFNEGESNPFSSLQLTSGLEPGNYTVEVTDQKGCKNSQTVTINGVTDDISYSISDFPPSCPGGVGSASISALGGTPPYLYSWNGGALSPFNTNSNLLAGVVNYTIEDANGCTKSDGFVLDEPEVLAANVIANNDVVCFGDNNGEIVFSLEGGTPNYFISFFEGGSNIGDFTGVDGSPITYSGFTQGNNYSFSMTDANGCPGPITLFEIGGPADIIKTGELIVDVDCFGDSTGSIEVIINGGSGVYTYTWTDVNGVEVGTNSNTINNLVAGLYNLNVDDGSCDKDYEFVVNEEDEIELFNISTNNVSCFGENDGSIFNTIISGGVGNYNLIWTNNANNSSILSTNMSNPIVGLDASSYTLKVIDEVGCTVESLTTVTISEPEAVSLSLSNFNPPSCFNFSDGSIQVLADGGTPSISSPFYTYSITNVSSGAVVNDNFASGLSEGDYEISVVDQNNCPFDTTIFLDDPEDLDFSAQVLDVSCFNGSDGALVYSYTGITTPNPIYYSNTLTINNIQTVFDSSAINLATGEYTSVLTDDNGCTKTITNIINQPDPLTYSVSATNPSCSQGQGNNILLSNGQFEFIFSDGTPDYNLYFNGDTLEPNSGLPLFINNLEAGNYDFVLEDANGCILSFNESISAPSEIEIFENITNVSTIGGSDGQIDITVVGGQAPYTYSWTMSNSGFTSINEDVLNLSGGVYNVTITDANGCIENKLFTVNDPSCNVNITPVVTSPQCSGDNALLNFDLSGGLAPYNLEVKEGFLNVTYLDVEELFATSLDVPLSVPSGGNPILEGYDANGCPVSFNFQSLVEDIEPISVSPQIIDASCPGLIDGQIIIDPSTDISGGTGPYNSASIIWQGLDLNPVNPNALSTGVYIVTITDNNDCSETLEYFVGEPEPITILDTNLVHPDCLEGSNTPGNNGSINVVPQGGDVSNISGYQYLWVNNNIPSIQNPSGLSPGSYQLIIADQNCTSETFEITLDSPEQIFYVTHTTNPISCFNECDGGFSVTTANPANEVFSWYNEFNELVSGDSSIITNLCDGSYYFEIINNSNCFVNSQSLDLDPASLQLTNPSQFDIEISASASVPNNVCDGVASVTSSGGVLPVTYSWSDGQSGPIAITLCGDSVYVVTATDNDGCVSEEFLIIPEEGCNFDVGTPIVTQPECYYSENGNVVIDAFIDGLAPYTIDIYKNSLLYDEVVVDANSIFTATLEEGDYNLVIESSNGCLTSEFIQIIKPEPFSFSYSIVNNDCFNTAPEAHITITGATPPYDIDNVEFIGGFEGYFAFEEGGVEVFLAGNSLSWGSSNPLIVTDALGCVSPNSVLEEMFTVSIEPSNPVVVSVSETPVKCADGNNTGFASVAASGGFPPYEYNWYAVGELAPLNDTLTDMNSMDSLAQGDYYVSVKDVNGCETIAFFTITAPEDIVVNSVISPPSCLGFSDASINIQSVTGGSGEFEYLWSPGGNTTNIVNNLSAGTYELFILEAGVGCEYVETFVIEDPDEISISINATDESCNTSDDGQVTATFSVPLTDLNSIQWYADGLPISVLDGGQSPSLANKAAGIYNIEITNANNCLFSAEDTINEPDLIVISSDVTNPNCFGDANGEIVYTVEGGVGNYSFVTVDNFGATVSNTSNPVNLVDGSYSVIVSDQNDCVATETVVLNEPNDIILNVEFTTVTCNNGNDGFATFNPINNDGVGSITWSTITSLNNYTPIPSIDDTASALTAGNYILEFVDGLGCTQEETFTISEPDPIVVTPIIVPSSCSNENGATVLVQSTGVSPVEYSWLINQNDLVSTTGDFVDGLEPGTIFVEGTDANGCDIPFTEVVILSSPNPLIQVDIDLTQANLCNGNNNAVLEVDLFNDDNSSISGNVTYQWFADGAPIPASEGGTFSTLSNLGPGEYVVVVSENLYDCSNSDTIIIEEVAPFSVNLTLENDTIQCFSENNGAVSTQTVNGVAPFSYTWDNPMGLNIANDIPDPNNLIAGTYNLTVTDFNGCEYAESFEILQNDSLYVESTPNPALCFESEDGYVLTNFPTGGVSPYSYEWRNESDEIVSIDDSPNSLNSQTYYLKLTDALGCLFFDTLFVDQPDDLVVDEEIININCYGGNTGSISVDVSGGTAPYVYNWSNDLPNNNTVINLEAGVFDLTVVDFVGCKKDVSFQVEQEDEILVLDTGIFQSCTEGIAQIDEISGGIPPYEVYWLDDPVENNNTTFLNNLTPGTYTYYVNDANNCVLIDSVSINGTNEINTVILDYNDISCNGDSDGQIDVFIQNANNYPYTYSLNDQIFDEGNIISEDEFNISNLTAGVYTIYIKDGEECIDTVGTVTLNEPEILSLSASTQDVVCNGESNGVIAFDIEGGVGDYQLALNDVNNVILNTTGIDTVPVSSGEYILIAIDENNCTVSEEVIINQPELLALSISGISNYNGFNTSCYYNNDGFFTVNVNGGSGNYTLNINDSSFYEVENEYLLENLSAGVYSLSIEDTNGCVSTIEATIDSPEELIYDFTDVSNYNGYNTSCYGQANGFIQTVVSGGVGTYDFSSNGGITFEISNSISNQYEFSSLSEGDYVFVVKDQNNCIDSIDYTITSAGEIIPYLNSTVGIDCSGSNQGAAFIGVQGGVPTYVYSLEDEFGTIETIESPESLVQFDALNSGNYFLSVEDANGCSNTFSNSLSFDLSDGQTISVELDVTSPSCNSFNNGSVNISNIEGGVAPFNIKLLLNNFPIYETTLSEIEPVTFPDLESSTYSLKLFDANGCSFDTVLVVDQPNELDVSLESSNITCFGINDGTIDLSINGGTSPYSINLNNQVIETGDEYVFDNLEVNSYTLSITDSQGCSYNDEISISQPDSISIMSTSVNSPCFNLPYGALAFDVTGGSTPYQYLLTTSSGTIIADSVISDSVFYNSPPLYADQYIISITDNNNCFDSLLVNITEPEEIIIEHVVTNVSCPNSSDGAIETSVSNFQDAYELFWQSDNLSGETNTGLSAGQYVLTVVDNFNCVKVDTVEVMSAYELTFELNLSPPSCSYINNGELEILFDGQQDYSSVLTSVNYSEQMDGFTNHVYNQFGDGDYNLTILYNSNCTFDTTFSIVTNDGFDCIIPDPTFSPNADGINDAFSPVQYFDKGVELIVFNRWGEKVFQENSTNPSWDGTNSDGELLPSADYYYIIKFNDNAFNDLTGIITLLK